MSHARSDSHDHRKLADANGTDDLEVALLHLEMVSLLTQRMDRYDRLLDKYQQPPNLGTAAGM